MVKLDKMPGRRRKSLRLHATSMPGRSTTAVKEEMDDDDVKPYAPSPNVLPSHCAVNVETGDGEGKPDISAGHKKAHAQSKHSKRRRGAKYGRDSHSEYIMSIAQQMKLSLTDAVSGVGERLFHNVLKCLIDVIVASQTKGIEEKTIEVNINSDGFDSLAPLADQEHYLKKILTLLLCMARMRVYSPPSVNEVVYYREIKKHIRCMIAYNEAKGNTKDVKCAYSKDPASHHSTSCSQVISAVEELIELNGTLAGITPHIWDLNHKNGAAPDVAIHVESNFEYPPEPNWNTEKVNAFYYNKLILVLHDLKCSGLAGLSPESNEEKAFDALINYVKCPMHVNKADEMAVSSYKRKPMGITPRKREGDTMDVMLCSPGGIHRINGLFDGRLFEYVDELRRSCLSFMLKVMDKLGTVVYPVELHRRFGNDAEDIINQLLNRRKVHPTDSPDYIESINQ